MASEEIIPFPKELIPTKQSLSQRVFAAFYTEKRLLSEHELVTIMKISWGGNVSRVIKDLISQGILEKIICPTCKSHIIFRLKKQENSQKKKPRKK